MAEKTLTVYEALVEISRLNDIIKSRNLKGYTYVSYGTEKGKLINGVPRETFKSELQSNYDTIRHLISNLAEYKAKVALSNATTTITVAGKEYTIAEAIQRKNNIDYEVAFVNDVKLQIAKAVDAINSHNWQVDQGLAGYLEKVKGENSSADDIKKLTDTYNENNKFVMIDPNKLVTSIDVMSEDIDTFKTEVDTKITASNCTTIITVNLDD